jgi:hypothetical protein
MSSKTTKPRQVKGLLLRRCEAGIVHAMRLFALTSILCWCVVQTAAAQAEDPWLIVGTTSSLSDAWMKPTASKLRTELLQRGVEVWSLQSAATRFSENGSAAPAVLSEARIEAWAEQSRSGLWHLAMGEPQEALGELNQAQELSRLAIESLNRDEKRVQKVIDTCLYTVRALLETGFGTEAKALAGECRELAPRGEPSANMHPAFVLEFLKAADASRTERSATLLVESEPSGCGVRVNGLRYGETPVEVGGLLPAKYRVQVECDPDRRGRVHVADASGGAARVFVDSRFDHAVETEPLTRLRYPTTTVEEQLRLTDAEEIAKAVPASAVLLMSMRTPRTLEIELLRGTPLEKAALARIEMGAQGASRGDIALAARALVDGRCADYTKAPPVVFSCGAATEAVSEESPSTERNPRGKLISGLTLTAAGSAALISGYVLLAPRARAGEDWVTQLDSGEQRDGVAQQRWINLGTGLVLTSSVGAAALVAAMPLALPKRAKPPWWAWLSGGLGVGLAAFSIAYGVTAEATPDTSCSNLGIASTDAQSCIRRGEQLSIAILTGVTAAPLLTIPLVYLFRRDEARFTPGVELSRSGGYLSVSGEF